MDGYRIQGKGPVDYAKDACDTMMRRFEAAQLPPKGHFHYHQGVFLSGVMKTYELTGEEKYFQYCRDWVDSIVGPDGMIRQFDPGQLDDIQPGILLYPLYKRTGDERYRTAILTLASILWNFPRTEEGGYWHKVGCAHQMWLDGLYMGGPIGAQFGRDFGHPEFFDRVAFQALLMEQKTRDEKTGLLYHGWDSLKSQEWADPVTGRAPEFWGRAMGWVPVALLDDLDFFPEDHKDRPELIRMAADLLKSLCPWQGEDGLWYQVVNKPSEPGNWPESSCTCLYGAAICKAVRLGYLDTSYLDCARRAYEGIIRRLKWDENGIVVDNICIGTGIGDYEFYCRRPTSVNDLHGMGAFLILLSETEKLARAGF